MIFKKFLEGSKNELSKNCGISKSSVTVSKLKVGDQEDRKGRGQDNTISVREDIQHIALLDTSFVFAHSPSPFRQHKHTQKIRATVAFGHRNQTLVGAESWLRSAV